MTRQEDLGVGRNVDRQRSSAAALACWLSLASEVEGQIAVFAGAELNALRLGHRLAVANRLDANLVVVARTRLQVARNVLTIGTGAGRGRAVDENLGVGGNIDAQQSVRSCHADRSRCPGVGAGSPGACIARDSEPGPSAEGRRSRRRTRRDRAGHDVTVARNRRSNRPTNRRTSRRTSHPTSRSSRRSRRSSRSCRSHPTNPTSRSCHTAGAATTAAVAAAARTIASHTSHSHSCRSCHSCHSPIPSPAVVVKAGFCLRGDGSSRNGDRKADQSLQIQSRHENSLPCKVCDEGLSCPKHTKHSIEIKQAAKSFPVRVVCIR